MVKNLPERQETPVRSLGWEDPLQKGMASTAAFFSGEAGGCGGGQSGGCRGSDMTEPLSPSGFFPQTVSKSLCSEAYLLGMQTLSFQTEMMSWTNQPTKNKWGAWLPDEVSHSLGRPMKPLTEDWPGLVLLSACGVGKASTRKGRACLFISFTPHTWVPVTPVGSQREPQIPGSVASSHPLEKPQPGRFAAASWKPEKTDASAPEPAGTAPPGQARTRAGSRTDTRTEGGGTPKPHSRGAGDSLRGAPGQRRFSAFTLPPGFMQSLF